MPFDLVGFAFEMGVLVCFLSILWFSIPHGALGLAWLPRLLLFGKLRLLE